MKNFVIVLLLSFLTIETYAGKPPRVVSNALKQKFPSATDITWKRDSSSVFHGMMTMKGVWIYKNERYDYYWIAEFKLGNKNASAEFSTDGHWLWAEVERTYSEVREEVKNAIKRDYSNCGIISIHLGEFVGGGSWYDVRVKCGSKEFESSYDENGWLPPRIL